MQTFLQRLAEHIARVRSKRVINAKEPLNVIVVGGGAGGVEVALCLPHWLERKLGCPHFRISIVHRRTELLAGAAERTVRLVTSIFDRRGVQLCLGQEAVKIGSHGVQVRWVEVQAGADADTFLNADLVISAVGAVAPRLLERLDVAKDDRGFVLTNACLESLDCSGLFIVGDSGTLQHQKVAKAGVYAVRQGPILWRNLKKASQAKTLEEFKPQSDFLWLMNTGDRRAILQYHGAAIHATWCWWLKNWIDQRFVHKHQD